ncbi:MAG TPA: hypothetical protein VEZ14_12820 [Dehalococcoidia bacterium]|nr:hypothetical protein [Dehalococcoidia bacterium]
MTLQTAFDGHLLAGRFKEATKLLQEELLSGRLLDPRTDQVWAPFADTIAGQYLATGRSREVAQFWEEMLRFFVAEVEPKWGHTHKGHLHFRLGFAFASNDFARARREFLAAYEQDLQLERSGQGEASLRSAYVALVLFDRIDEGSIGVMERREFVSLLFGPSFDAAILGQTVAPDEIQRAFGRVVRPDLMSVCESTYAELHAAALSGMSVAVTSLAGACLECVLLSELMNRGVTEIDVRGKAQDVLKADLGALMIAAAKQRAFPSGSIETACKLLHHFRNRLHPGNELRQDYPLVPRVALTLRVLFDLTLYQWHP